MLSLEDEGQISDGVCTCERGPLHSTPIKDSSVSSSTQTMSSRQKMNDFHKTSERGHPGNGQGMRSECRSRDAPGAPESTTDSGFSSRMAVSGCEGNPEQHRSSRSELGSRWRREPVMSTAKGGVRRVGLGTRSQSLQHLNVCNNSNDKLELESSGVELKYLPATTASYIEQDVIDKQRQEIHLLMEELGTRDRELNDLVSSHQYQVKAWEKDQAQMADLRTRLTKYEGDLQKRDDQLRITLKKMAQVSEQREVEAAELQRTKTEMEKLNQRIRENSQYLLEMEIQNENMGTSLRDLVALRKELERRGETMTEKLESKSKDLKEKTAELENALVYTRTLEAQFKDLKETQSNLSSQLEMWKNRYRSTKNENDRLQGDVKKKEDNLQKVTLQLNESLQQAIALQKALFTSCEREKCKDEVLQSMKKQQKRTMQELANMRQLFDHQELTLYKLSVKEKDKDHKGQRSTIEEPCSEGQTSVKEANCKTEAKDKNKEKQNRNMSSNIDKAQHLLAQSSASKSEPFLHKEEVYHRRSASLGGFEVSSHKSNSGPRDHGERLRTAWSADRASQFQFNPSHCSVGTSPMFSTEAGQVQRPIKQKEASFKSVREQPRTETESSLPKAKIFANRRMVRQGSKVKGCEQVTSQKAAAKAEHPSFGYSMLQESPPSIRGQGQEKPPSEQMQNETSGVFESSSDVSPLSSPERRFEDDLTPADSEGMCHELKRDISKVGQGHLRSILKDATNVTDPTQAFMSSGADDEATPPPRCILKKHSSSLATGGCVKKNLELSVSFDSKVKSFTSASPNSESEDTKESSPETKPKVPQNFTDSHIKYSAKHVQNTHWEGVHATSQKLPDKERVSSGCVQPRDTTKPSPEEQSRSTQKLTLRKPAFKVDRNATEKVSIIDLESGSRDVSENVARVNARENSATDSIMLARKQAGSDSLQRSDTDVGHRAATRCEGHRSSVQTDCSDLGNEVLKQKNGKQIVNEEKVEGKYNNLEVGEKNSLRVGEDPDDVPSKRKKARENVSDDKRSIKQGTNLSPSSTLCNAKSSSSSEPFKVKGHGSEKGSLSQCQCLGRTSPECSRRECDKEDRCIQAKPQRSREVSPCHVKKERVNKISPIHSKRQQMKALSPTDFKRGKARDNNSICSNLKQARRKESSPSVRFENHAHYQSSQRPRRDTNEHISPSSPDRDATAASSCRNVTITSPNFSISINMDDSSKESLRQAPPQELKKRPVEECLEEDLSEYRTAVSSLHSSCCHVFTPMECLMTSSRKTFSDSQYLTRPVSYLMEKEKVPLPEDVAVYLARQRPLKRNLYLNNNKSVVEKVQNTNQGGSDAPSAESTENETCSGRALTSERTTPSSGDKDRSFQGKQAGKDVTQHNAGETISKESVLKEDSSSSTMNSFLSFRKDLEEKAENERMYFYKEMEESETDWGSEGQVESVQRDSKQWQEVRPLSKNNNRSLQPFCSTKAPSLFRQLSQIHFCERTRRYEWAAPNVHHQCETDTNANCNAHTSEAEAMAAGTREEKELVSVNKLQQMAKEAGEQKMLTEEQRVYEERDISAFEVFTESNCNNSSCLSDSDQWLRKKPSDHRCVVGSHEEELESSFSEVKGDENGVGPKFVNVTFEDNSSLDKFSHHFGNIVRRLEFTDSLLDDSAPVVQTGVFIKQVDNGQQNEPCREVSPDKNRLQDSHSSFCPSDSSPNQANVSVGQVDIFIQQADWPRCQPVTHPSQPVTHPSQPVTHPILPVTHPIQPVVYPIQPVTHPIHPVTHPSQPVVHPNEVFACPSEVFVCFNKEELGAEFSHNEHTQSSSSMYAPSKFEIPERDVPTHSEHTGRTVSIVDGDANLHGVQQNYEVGGQLQHWSRTLRAASGQSDSQGHDFENMPEVDMEPGTKIQQFVVHRTCLNNRAKRGENFCGDSDLDEAAWCLDSVTDVMCSSVLDDTEWPPPDRVVGSGKDITSLPEYFQDISTLLIDPEDEMSGDAFFDLVGEKGMLPQKTCPPVGKEEKLANSSDEEEQLANKLITQEKYLLSKELQLEKHSEKVHPVISVTQKCHEDQSGQTEKLDIEPHEPSSSPEDPSASTDLLANKSKSSKSLDTKEGINSQYLNKGETDSFLVKEKPISPDLEESSVQGLELTDKPPGILSPQPSSSLGFSSRLSRWYPDSVEQVSDQFEERLSSFLEDSCAEDSLKDSTTVTPPMSPATKLHRLLLESQQMIHKLEKTSSVPESKTVTVPSSLSS